MSNDEERLHLGAEKNGALFPVAPSVADVGKSYVEFIGRLKSEVAQTHLSVTLHANIEMTLLYWRIGSAIRHAQDEFGWGAKVIDRISQDLHDAFPDMHGFSSANLRYMRRFSTLWSEEAICQQAVGKLPWGTNIVLMSKLDTPEDRLWYAEKALENGWSRNVLALQIESHLKERTRLSVSNFENALPPSESDMAEGIFKDPYLFDFLGTADAHREVEVEQALTDHIQEFLLELGQGFAFVGRQVHLEVGGDDFYIDLLFYHLALRRYIVIELKAQKFEPSFVSQLSMYQAAVDDLLRHEGDKPSIGLLLVRGKNEVVARYSLTGYNGPMGVADWTERLEKSLPEDLKSSLPSIEEIEIEMGASFEGEGEV